MKKLIVASAFAFLAAASPAFAQDDDGGTPRTQREPSAFNGVSIAAIGGIDVLTIQENNVADATRGLMYGGSIGYDHDVGSVVLGIQGEITSSQASYKVDGLLTPGDHFASEAGRDIYGGVRIGFVTGRSTLLYIGAGCVNSQLTSVYTDNSGTIRETEEKGGFRGSLGVEFAGQRFFGRLEGRYQDLGDYTVFSYPTGFARTHTQIVAGVGVRF